MQCPQVQPTVSYISGLAYIAVSHLLLAAWPSPSAELRVRIRPWLLGSLRFPPCGVRAPGHGEGTAAQHGSSHDGQARGRRGRRSHRVMGELSATPRGVVVDKRDSVRCTSISGDDIQRRTCSAPCSASTYSAAVPGWQLLSDYTVQITCTYLNNRETNYCVQNSGDGWDKVDSNPTDAWHDVPPRRSLVFISSVSVSGADVSHSDSLGAPRGNTQSQTSGGTTVAADGSVSLSATEEVPAAPRPSSRVSRNPFSCGLKPQTTVTTAVCTCRWSVCPRQGLHPSDR